MARDTQTGRFTGGSGAAAVVDDMAGDRTETTVDTTASTETAETAETTERSDTGDTSERRMTLREAWDAAKAEHSLKHEPAGRVAETPAEEDETDEAASSAAATARGKGKAQPETADPDDLLTDAEYSALETQHAGDPKAFRRALQKAYTQKTQALAAERSSLERLQPYTALVDAIESDDPAVATKAVRQLAKELGITNLAEEVAAERTETSTTTSAEATAALLEKVRAKLGPELEYMADSLLPTIQEVLKDVLDAELGPVRDLVKTTQAERAVQQTGTVIAQFEKDHPDWKEHEATIVDLMTKFEPSKGVSETDYLSALYTIATAPKTAAAIKAQVEAGVAKGVKTHVEKINRGATTAETRMESTADTQITQRRPPNATIQDAYAAAKKGIRWTDDD